MRLDQFQRSEEHTSELQSPQNLVCRLLLEKKKRPLITARSTHKLKPLICSCLIVGGIDSSCLAVTTSSSAGPSWANIVFFLLSRRPRSSTLFPYTTLSR